MQIFGVGPLELLLILVLALVIMGPQDMVGTARKLGGWIYRMVRSPTWRAIMETTQEFRDLPTKIVRDAGLDEAIKEIKDTADQVKSEMDMTTREIQSEMAAATSEINREMSSASESVTGDLQKIASEATLAAGDAPAALAAGDAPFAAAGAGEPETPAIVDPESILWPEPAPEEQPLANIAMDISPEIPVDPYVAQLDIFAQALGGPMKNSAGLEQAPAPRQPDPGLFTPIYPQTSRIVAMSFCEPRS